MRFLFVLLSLLVFFELPAQYRKEDIYSEFVLYGRRAVTEKNLRENVVAKTFTLPLDSSNEYKFEEACAAVAQYLIRNNNVKLGFQKMFAGYAILPYETRRAFMEAVYAVYPKEYAADVRAVMEQETHPKIFSMCASYLARQDSSEENINDIKIRILERYPGYDTIAVLQSLHNYLTYHHYYSKQETPALAELFKYKRPFPKTIYSFQRWNRNFAGMAIVQNADGSFMRHPDGRLMVFEQLARSGSDLPYFITNGSTPQGVYSIQGGGISRNHLIGPTPNIQLMMPFEDSLQKYFHRQWDSSLNPVNTYLQLLPPSWRTYQPMMEAVHAGKVGRTEIIAHGTTINPEFFKDEPFYPLTPTMGCLCAKELWNVTTGKLLVSEQLNLYSAFMATPGNKGYLIVINLDDKQMPVSRADIEKFTR